MNSDQLKVFMRRAVAIAPAVKPYLSAKALQITKYTGDISSINATYHDAITDALVGYFENGGSVAGPANAMKRACATAFNDASDAGWVDGGGELPIEGEALSWVNARTSEEFGHIDGLLQEAKELRKEEGFDYFSYATNRADGYTSTVLSIYNACVLFAKNNQLLTWHLGETETHCDTCLKLDGHSHRASWYIKYDYIPRKPDAGMDCHGYNCDCWLEDKNGDAVTI